MNHLSSSCHSGPRRSWAATQPQPHTPGSLGFALPPSQTSSSNTTTSVYRCSLGVVLPSSQARGILLALSHDPVRPGEAIQRLPANIALGFLLPSSPVRGSNTTTTAYRYLPRFCPATQSGQGCTMTTSYRCLPRR